MPKEPQPIVLPQSQQADADRAVAASNRPTNLFSARQVLNYTNDDIVNALENTPPSQKGSRKRPTLIRYPSEIGSGQYPHVMQFKIFWRWESKELTDSKAESEKNVQVLSTMNDLIQQGQFNADGFQNLDPQTTQAIQEVLYDKKLLKTVNPSVNDDLATLLQQNPQEARAIMEQTIASYQTRVTALDAEISGDGGAVTMDEDERQQVNSRVNNVLEETSALEAGIKAGLFAGGAQAISSLASGKNWKRSALDGLKTGGAAGVAVGGVIAIAKALQNQPKYDQMVSIYLPMCTKIGNEDTFVYEDASGAAVSGALDAMNSTTDSIAQGTVAAAIVGANKIGQGGAFGAISGLVLNPRLEKVFKAKDFRTFSFSWEFYPKNSDEAQQIKDMIETFRYHANPSYDEELVGKEGSSAKIILRAPAEFTVRFLSTNPNPNYGGFVENEYIPKIARLACSSITVDYSVNGVFSTFRDNAPTAVTLTMSFQEIETLTREAVDKGY